MCSFQFIIGITGVELLYYARVLMIAQIHHDKFIGETLFFLGLLHILKSSLPYAFPGDAAYLFQPYRSQRGR